MPEISTTEKPATKKEIFLWLNKFNEKTVRAEINNTISKMRDIPLKEAKDKKTLKPSEVRAVMQLFA